MTTAGAGMLSGTYAKILAATVESAEAKGSRTCERIVIEQ